MKPEGTVEPPAREITRGIVAVPLHCRRCGYNLCGLPSEGSCPECGLEVWASILHTVDPAASDLPRLRNPKGVGDALLWLMILLGVGSLLLMLRPVAGWLDTLDRSGLRDLAGAVPRSLPIVAGVLGLVSVWWAGQLAPPPTEAPSSPAWRHLRLLVFGLAAWSCLVVGVGLAQAAGVGPQVIRLLWLAAALAGIAALTGLGGILEVVGLRSREYRTARGGRQGTKAMVAATAGEAAGLTLQLLAGALERPGLATVGDVISAICALMIVIGLVYLLVNAAWIRRSLRCPPPRLEEILGAEPPAP